MLSVVPHKVKYLPHLCIQMLCAQFILKYSKKMNKNYTWTRNLPVHWCRYWNIVSYGIAKRLKHFLECSMAKEYFNNFFVDSTILVNVYHIYSTVCNYDSSLSNLCFTCWDASQVLIMVANFPPFLRPISSPISCYVESIHGENCLTPRQVA